MLLEAWAIGLLAVWLVAMISGFTLGGFIWICLIVAVLLFLVRLVDGPGQRHSQQYVPTEVKDWKREHMDILKKHVDLLGFKVRDKVTGFEGVVSTVSFDLYGCIQVIVTPPAKEGETKESKWFDIQRLVVTDSARVMPVPSFEALATAEGVHEKGPSEKPSSGRW